jgi:hypothetical protein
MRSPQGRSMVVCAVRYEPVSALQYPANREINREFRGFEAFASDINTKNHCAAVLSKQIPYEN